MIRVDQGTEFVSRDFDLWAYQCGVTLWRTARPERNRLEKIQAGRSKDGGSSVPIFSGGMHAAY